MIDSMRNANTVRKSGMVAGLNSRLVAILRLLFFASIACPMMAGPGGGLFSERVMESERPRTQIPRDGTIIRSRSVDIDIARLGAVRDALLRNLESADDSPSNDGLAVTIPLNLFDDVTYTAVVERTGTTSAGYSLSGRLEEMKLATFDLVVNGEIVFGWVTTPQATYGIQTGSGMGYGVSEIDPAIVCEVEDVPAESHSSHSHTR